MNNNLSKVSSRDVSPIRVYPKQAAQKLPNNRNEKPDSHNNSKLSSSKLIVSRDKTPDVSRNNSTDEEARGRIGASNVSK